MKSFILRKSILTLFFILFFLFIFGYFIRAKDLSYDAHAVISYENGSTVYTYTFLREDHGKNTFIFPEGVTLDAQTLFLLIPEIDAVTDLESQEGFIRAFGGIGKNFKFYSGKSYEVSVTLPLNLTLRTGGM